MAGITRKERLKIENCKLQMANCPTEQRQDHGGGSVNFQFSIFNFQFAISFAFLLSFAAAALAAKPEKFDEMSLDRWAKLREVERHQLNAADKYFGKGEWKIAITEYEKFLKLYESSEGASYAQMRWSICQVELRKLNTAIKDGFQSVIDYWPDSPEATKSAYLIAQTYRDMGQAVNAKKAYNLTIEKYPEHVVAVRSKRDLIGLARKENDDKREVELLKNLAFDTKRTPENGDHCVESAEELARLHFYRGEYDDAVKALETSYKDARLTHRIYEITAGPISTMTGDDAKKATGVKLADTVIALIEKQIPADLKDESAKTRGKTYYYWIAATHDRARRPADVLKTYQTMEKLFGVDDGLLENLAQWYRGQSKRDLARATYERFQNRIAGQSKIASMWREERKFDQAIAIYEGLEKEDRDHAGDWRWQIAECLDASGKVREAIGSYRLSDKYPQCLFAMASCHRRLKEQQPALEFYGQIITAYADSAASARYAMAETYEEMGKQENAIRTYQQVCRDYPKSGHASRAHAHLQNKYKINVTLGGAKDE